ncbi:hypothetical protein [Nocardia sp. XZ_19_369]|uniref:hypothetical protein n=1 Tax=Nocardia sp. XZ_19_369 TaxID=2769487 RepID=UPI00188DE47B|nr:hypothetical protein [Nocardia sp. XZ_19_369]
MTDNPRNNVPEIGTHPSFAFPAEYTLRRSTFDALTQTLTAHFPDSPDTNQPSRTYPDYRNIATEDGPATCFAIRCAHHWVAYATFATAAAILADEIPTTPTLADLDTAMLELTARQYLWINGNSNVILYWPTITVAPR